MSYRLLIADDEVKIIQLITQLGHWEELGIDIVGVCSDGEDALCNIISLKPDIVLTDIKMPLLDGIQMIEEVKKKDIDTNFIVLSGYKHFEYARSAIQLGVVDYLLKPLDEEQLNRTLERTCRKIDERRQRSCQQDQLERYLELNRKEAQKKFWEIALTGKTETSSYFSEVSVCNQTFQTEFHRDAFLCVHISTNIDTLLYGNDSLLEQKIEECCRKILDSLCIYVSYVGMEGVYLILNFERKEAETIKRAVSALFYSVKNLADIYGDFMLNIGVSTIKTHVKRLGDAVVESRIAKWGRLVYFGDRVVEYDAVKALPRFSVRDIMTEEQEIELNTAIRTFHFERIGELFGEISRNAILYQNGYPGDMMHFMDYLMEKIIGIHREKEDSVEAYRLQLILAEKNARNFHQMIKEFYTCYNQQLHKKLEELQSKMGKPVEEAVRYMKANYGRQISMEELAQRAKLSPGYFSKLFKAEMNVGFVEYLTQIRMEAAQKLLVESNDSVKEIAYEVGYMDDKHFLKTFKKQVGISPKEYRKLYAG